MLPQAPQRKKKNSSTVNLLISLTFHGLIVLVLAFFAARGGMLGEKMKKIAVEMVKEKPEEKPPEPEKPKEEPPKPEELPKPTDPPRLVEAPKVEAPKELPPVVSAPPVAVAPPPSVSAPAAVDVPSFAFDGGTQVQTTSNPSEIYRGFLEYALRSRWERPDDLADGLFVAEVEVSIDATGRISRPVWKKDSGNARWDESVRRAIAATPTLNRPPPTNFPPRVLIRFDVQTVADETSTLSP